MNGTLNIEYRKMINRWWYACLTCKMANMMTNMVTTSKQAATAIDVIVVKAEPKCDNKPVESLPLPIRASSATDDSCCCSAPLAIRRLPAGDELMQPPVQMSVEQSRKVERKKKQKIWMKCDIISVESYSRVKSVHSSASFHILIDHWGVHCPFLRAFSMLYAVATSHAHHNFKII